MPVTDTPQAPGATSPGGSPNEHGPGRPHCWTIAEMDRVVGR